MSLSVGSREQRYEKKNLNEEETSLTQAQTKTSKSVMDQQGGRVYGSAEALLSVSSNGGNIREAAANSIRQIQASRTDNSSHLVPLDAKGSDLKAPKPVRVENGAKELDKRSPVKVLHGLWKCSSPASFFDHRPDLLPEVEKGAWANRKKLEQDLKQNPKVDYYGGRCIKTNVSKWPPDLSSYTKYCVPSMTPDEVIQKCIQTEAPDEKPKDFLRKAKDGLKKAVDWIEEYTPPGGF